MENRLKERLVGATVLMLLAVIFIPMLLDGPSGAQPVTQAIPLPDAAGDARRTVRIELGAPQGGQRSTAVARDAGEPASIDLVPEQQESRPEGEVAKVTEKTPERRPEPAPATRQPAAASPWLVQAGAFGSRSNAEGMLKTLQDNGFPAFIQEHREAGRVHYRVRVGGYDSREAAERAAADIRERTGQAARAMAAD